MMMKTRLFQAAAGLLVLCSVAAQAAGYQEGKQYTDMPKAVPGAPAVVEFSLSIARPVTSLPTFTASVRQ
ncbi:hypothetical protein O0544_00690 [Edwardsiella anguillarum]|nr:hypothetical protein [Edwardsiella anguillarum]